MFEIVKSCPFIFAALTAPIWATACQGSATRSCANGWLCPDGQVCVEGYDRCGKPEAVDACEFLEEGEICTYKDTSLPGSPEVSGVCRDKVCAVGCGNQYLDVGELCDGAPPDKDNCVLHGFDMGKLQCSSSCDSAPTGQCQIFGWERFDANVDWQLGRLWGTSANNLYSAGAVGAWGLELIAECTLVTKDCGRIFHYDGHRWRAYETNSPLLVDVWGSGPDNIYAVGTAETILHSRDGKTWSEAYTSDCYSLGCDNFAGIWGSGPDDIFAVGVFGLIVHYDGTSWTKMQTPDTRGAIMTAIWGTGPSDVYAAGTDGVIWHYDGNASGRWVEMNSGTTLDVNYIWGTGPNNVIASGKDQLILRYDGNEDLRWVVVNEGLEEDRALTAMWGTSPEEIYIAGTETPLLRYNSVTDEIVTFSESVTSWSFLGMWGESAEDFWVVGVDGIILRRMPFFDWTTTDLTTSEIHGIWEDTASGERFAVGDEIWHYQPLTEPRSAEYLAMSDGTWHYLDGHWSTMAAEHDGKLLDVWGTGSSNVFVVSSEGEILRYDGSGWSKMNLDNVDQRIFAVWGSSATDIFAVGEEGLILHYDGNAEGRWERMYAGADVDLKGVWGGGADNVYAAGDRGTILHYDGNPQFVWNELESITPLPLNAVWVDSTGEVFAVGNKGVILHYDASPGGTWKLINSSTIGNFLDVWGDSAGNVYAVGVDGRIVHYDGTQWSRIRAGAETQMYTVWGRSSPPAITVAGERGSLNELRFVR